MIFTSHHFDGLLQDLNPPEGGVLHRCDRQYTRREADAPQGNLLHPLHRRELSQDLCTAVEPHLLILQPL